MRSSDLTKVHVELQGNVFNLDAGVESKIDGDLEGLNQCLASHPFLAARWRFIEMKVREIIENLEAEEKVLAADLETIDADLFVTLPAKIEREGKKSTVDAIKAHVVLDPRHQDAAKKIQDLQAQILTRRHELNLILAGRYTMQDRKDCLLALASNMRAEMDYNLRVSKGRMDKFFSKPQEPEPPEGGETGEQPGW